jgi:hypothetical protein
MTHRQAFKFAMISRCIEAGATTPRAALNMLKQAADPISMAPAIALDAAGKLIDSGGKALTFGWDTLAGVGRTLGPLALAAPPALGYLGGRMAARMGDIGDADIQETKQNELIAEYQRQAARLRREGQLRNFTRPGVPSRPLL